MSSKWKQLFNTASHSCFVFIMARPVSNTLGHHLEEGKVNENIFMDCSAPHRNRNWWCAAWVQTQLLKNLGALILVSSSFPFCVIVTKLCTLWVIITSNISNPDLTADTN